MVIKEKAQIIEEKDIDLRSKNLNGFREPLYSSY